MVGDKIISKYIQTVKRNLGETLSYKSKRTEEMFFERVKTKKRIVF